MPAAAVLAPLTDTAINTAPAKDVDELVVGEATGARRKVGDLDVTGRCVHGFESLGE